MSHAYRIHGGCPLRRYATLGALFLTGCSETDPPSPSVMVRDSAGVTIVESNQPLWTGEDVWKLGAEPVLSFGEREALFQIRGARRLEDGRIVLGHASVPEVLIYSSAGILLERIGGRGSGPGEFVELSRYQTGMGDSILVYDYLNQRLSVLDREGRYHRSMPTPSLPTGNLAFPEGIFSDGSFLVTPFGGPPFGNGLVRGDRELWRLSPDGTSASPLATFPELDRYFFSRGGGTGHRQPFFGKTAYYVAGGDRLLWGVTERFEIRAHDLDGQLTSIYRKSHAGRTFGRADVERLIEDAVSGIADENARRSRRAALLELPQSGDVPAFGWPDYGPSFGPALQLDDSGNLWIAEYYMPGETRNRRTVFNAMGSWLGSVDLPAGFTTHHIGEDFVLGVWRDEYNVEQVHLYELIKPAG